jgi:7,8-dihydropterin-6-yl-methyl-4-(beta-D-ribofuranosyl)aminobenzene 5'-phosphate synthase
MRPNRTARAWSTIAALLLVGVASDRLVAHDGPGEPPSGARIRSLKVVVLSTMLADTKGLGEWGFSALVEADGHRLLFDTGARSRTVLDNARELGLDLSDITDVVLSHHHGDHTGGLLTLRRELKTANAAALSRTYVGRGIFLSRPDPDGRERNETIVLKAPYESSGGQFVEVAGPTQIFPGAWLTGPVPRRHPERNWSGRGQVRTAEGLVEDTVPEDMSLVLETEKGLVVLSGCGHAGIVNTCEFAREAVRAVPVHAVLGGIHLFPASDETLDWTAGKLKAAGVTQMLGAHCTGVETVYELRAKLGLDRKRCVVGAVGSGFTLEDGIQPGTIAR